MSLASMIKKNTKKALKNHWSKAIGVFLIPLIVSLVLAIAMGFVTGTLFKDLLTVNDLKLNDFNRLWSYLNEFSIVFFSSFIYSVLSFLIVTPLMLGAMRWYFQLAKGNAMSVSAIFYFFEKGRRYWKSLGISISLGIRKWLWRIAFMILPSIITTASIILLVNNANVLDVMAYKILIGLGFIVLFIGIIVVSFLGTAHLNRYFLAEYILGISDSNRINSSIKHSVKYMKKYKYNVFWFKLSFIGWMVLGGVFFPLMFYVSPYYNTALAVYAQYVLETIRREQPVLIDQIPDFKYEECRPEINIQILSNRQNEEQNLNPVWDEDFFNLDDIDI